MFRIFWKSIFSSFLLIFLLVNLSIAFNIPLFNNQPFIDFDNKYFSFSTLYHFLDTGFVEDSNLLSSYKSYLRDIIDVCRRMVYGNWSTLAKTGGVYDLPSFFTAVGYFFQTIGGFFVGIYYVLVFLIYIVFVLAWILFKFVLLGTGSYWSTLPPYLYAV